MGSLPIELNLLETRPSLVFKTISNFLSEVASIGSFSERKSRLDQFINGLISEKSKIEMFDRVLPLSKLLINDAIEILEKEYNHYQKIKSEEDNMMKWMSSCRLWTNTENKNIKIEPIWKTNFSSQKLKGVMEERNLVADDPFKSHKNEVVRGAYLPFHGQLTFPAAAKQREDAKSDLAMTGLSFLTCGALNPNEEAGLRGKSVYSTVADGLPNLSTVMPQPPPQQRMPARKKRRCWSHEMHKQFVYCLEQLGGSQVATPKQIRELMHVEGLTNDEVKSHLQKYRLHTQKAARANSGSSGSNSGSPAGHLQSGHVIEGSNVGMDSVDGAKTDEGKSERSYMN